MKIIRELHVTSDEFYDFLENEFLEQLNQSDKVTNYSGKLKKGLRYSNLSDNIYSKVNYEILDYHRHSNYRLQISSHTEMVITSYHTKETEKGIEVTLEQEKKNSSQSQNAIFRWLTELLYFGRLSENLYKIQEKIVKARNH